MEHAMMDMGHKMEKGEVGVSPEGEDRMMYPTLHISHKVPEEIMSKDVGHMCRFEIVGKIVSKSQNDNGNSVSLEVHKMGHIAEAGKKNFEEYQKMNAEEKEKYDKEEIGEEEE